MTSGSPGRGLLGLVLPKGKAGLMTDACVSISGTNTFPVTWANSGQLWKREAQNPELEGENPEPTREHVSLEHVVSPRAWAVGQRATQEGGSPASCPRGDEGAGNAGPSVRSWVGSNSDTSGIFRRSQCTQESSEVLQSGFARARRPGLLDVTFWPKNPTAGSSLPGSLLSQ